MSATAPVPFGKIGNSSTRRVHVSKHFTSKFFFFPTKVPLKCMLKMVLGCHLFLFFRETLFGPHRKKVKGCGAGGEEPFVRLKGKFTT